MDFHQNYFEIFQLSPTYKINLEQLSTKYRELQLSVHPDKFANATDQEKRHSVQWATQINHAYDTIKDPLARAIYLLELNDVSIEHSPNLDPAFLMEQIELREELEEIETGGASALSELDAYKQSVKKVIATLEDGFDRQYPDDLLEAEHTVYKMQFINKLLKTADQLEEKLLDY